MWNSAEINYACFWRVRSGDRNEPLGAAREQRGGVHAPAFASPSLIFSLWSHHPEQRWVESPHRRQLIHRYPGRRPRSPRRWRIHISGRSRQQNQPPPPVPPPGAPQARLPPSARIQHQMVVMATATAKVLSTALEDSGPDVLPRCRACA